jgi:hypothetical protein
LKIINCFLKVVKMKPKQLFNVNLALFLVIFSSQVSASLIGDEITGCAADASTGCATGNLFSSSPTQTVVDPGVEFSLGLYGIYAADFSANSFSISFDRVIENGAGLTQMVWEFSGLDWVDMPLAEIQDVELRAGNTFPVDSISFDSHSITIITGSVIVPGNSSVDAQFDIIFSPVPVPATAWLFGSGLVGLLGVGGRKKVALNIQQSTTLIRNSS